MDPRPDRPRRTPTGPRSRTSSARSRASKPPRSSTRPGRSPATGSSPGRRSGSGPRTRRTRRRRPSFSSAGKTPQRSRSPSRAPASATCSRSTPRSSRTAQGQDGLESRAAEDRKRAPPIRNSFAARLLAWYRAHRRQAALAPDPGSLQDLGLGDHAPADDRPGRHPLLRALDRGLPRHPQPGPRASAPGAPRMAGTGLLPKGRESASGGRDDRPRSRRPGPRGRSRSCGASPASDPTRRRRSSAWPSAGRCPSWTPTSAAS